jgi:hypothetical protein
MAKVRSTAASAKGVVSIRNKRGDEMFHATIGTEIPMSKIMWMVRRNQLHFTHEHDFAPICDGCKTQVCSCGAVQEDGEVY